ncbi:LiaF transmembrane domain-containing protein [Massilia sp. SM-13]|uniref:LiaF transmembrane domain-containing protein n=1 Tax=Pseudoduganella rhizocola TaxID=3382643 RepID=UPI0038B50D80
MRTRRERSPAGQVVVGVAVIVVGMLFLLDNLGWLDFDFDFQFWPMILIVAGSLKLMQARSSKSQLVGGGLLLFGLLLMLKGMGLIYISWRVMAPLVMIAVGLMVVFRSAKQRKDGAGDAIFGMSKEEDGGNVVNMTAILGASVRRCVSQDYRGGELTAMMGGCELDLRDASINGDVYVHVFAMMGGITIKIPADWQVELEGTPILGGFDEKTVLAKGTGKRLIVRGYAIMGGVEVRN